jgi:hypothetical protein
MYVFFEMSNTTRDVSYQVLLTFIMPLQSEFYRLKHCSDCQLFVCSYGLLVRCICLCYCTYCLFVPTDCWLVAFVCVTVLTVCLFVRIVDSSHLKTSAI